VQLQPAALQAEQPLREEEPLRAQHWPRLAQAEQRQQPDVRPPYLWAEPRRLPDAAPWTLQPAEQPSQEDGPRRGRQAVSRQ
jgi:hypothetical protein